MNRLRHLVRDAARRVGLDVRPYRGPEPKFPAIDVFDMAVEREMRRRPDWFFVQVGAHDGASYDPVHQYVRRYGWRGVLVEPQPQIFAKLRKSYEGVDGLAFENAAVATQDGTATLYKFKDGQGLPYHATMLASFNRAAVERNGHGYVGEVEALPVPALTVRSLLAKHRVGRVDLLQIDTEGFDLEVIRMFVEADCWPTLIHFEDVLGLTHGNVAPFAPLVAKGYAFYHYGVDTLAYRQTDDADFRRRTEATQADIAALQPPPSA